MSFANMLNAAKIETKAEREAREHKEKLDKVYTARKIKIENLHNLVAKLLEAKGCTIGWNEGKIDYWTDVKAKTIGTVNGMSVGLNYTWANEKKGYWDTVKNSRIEVRVNYERVAGFPELKDGGWNAEKMANRIFDAVHTEEFKKANAANKEKARKNGEALVAKLAAAYGKTAYYGDASIGRVALKHNGSGAVSVTVCGIDETKATELLAILAELGYTKSN